MKSTTSFLLAIGFVALCACHRGPLSSTDRLAGTWNVVVVNPDGSSDTRGTLVVSTDGSYRSELVTSVSNQPRPVTLTGAVRIEDGYLVETTTNVVPHWLPEPMRGSLRPGGLTARSKISHLNEDRFVTATNSLGTVVFTRVSR
jgi:hypothetical protein